MMQFPAAKELHEKGTSKVAKNGISISMRTNF
jgi:hypothetical protein